MLPVFVINLDRSTERLARIKERCAAIKIPFERFPAISGADLPPNLRPYFCDTSGKIISRLMPGEIGCYASHLGVWQLIVERDLPAAMVCEDDADLPAETEALTQEIMAALPVDWDMVLLTSTPSHAFRPLSRLSNGGSVV